MITDVRAYRRSSLLGALGALLMLVGDLCLSVIPANTGDSGLFAREAYLSGGFDAWRLPLLLATGLLGMALRRSRRWRPRCFCHPSACFPGL